MKLEINLGDVLRALEGTACQGDEDCARIARVLGFGWSSGGIRSESTPPPREPHAPRAAEGTFELPKQVVMDGSESWLTSVSLENTDSVPQWYVDASTLPRLDDDDRERRAAIEPLFPKSWLRNLLRDTLLSGSACNSIDVERLVELVAQRAPISSLPRQIVSSLRYGAQVIVDVHASMAPYGEDQQLAIEEILRLLGRDQVEVIFVDGRPDTIVDDLPRASKSMPCPRKGWSVLLLTNLGAGPLGSGPSEERQSKWIEFAKLIQLNGHTIVALVPGSVDRVPIAIRRCLKTIPWDKPSRRGKPERSQGSDVDATAIKERNLRRIASCDPDVAKLAKYLSLAGRIPRALLRTARLQFCPKADASLEADLWFSSLVQTRTTDSILFYPEAAKELQQQLVASGELASAWNLLQRFHEFRPELVRMQERLTWLSLRQDEQSQQEFDADIASIIKSIVEQGRTGLGQWALSALKRLPPGIASHRTNLLRAVAKERVSGKSMPSMGTAEQQVWDEARAIIANNSELVRLGLFHAGSELRLSEPPEPGAEILSIPAQSVRSLTIGSLPIQWSADAPPPTVTVSPHSSIDIRVNGRGTYQMQPVQEVIASIQNNCLHVAGYLTSANGEVLGPAFAIDPNRMVTTQRTLAFAYQQGQHAAEGIDIQLMNGGRVQARLAAGSSSVNKDLQMADELAVLELQVSAHKFASIDFEEAAAGKTVFATSCSASGALRWARFEVEDMGSLGLRLQPFAMFRWLELQTWSGSMLFDSVSGRSVGFAVAGAGGLAIKVPEQTKPVDLHEKLNRVRPERLEIRYDVTTGTATHKRTLPFVVGIMGDVCGDSTAVRTLSNRRFITVDRDNLQTSMKELGITLNLAVPNLMAPEVGSELKVVLQFESLADFHPAKVAQQIPALNHLLTMRAALQEWCSLMARDSQFEDLIKQNIYYESEFKEFAMSSVGSVDPITDQAHERSTIRLDSERLLSQLQERMPAAQAERLVVPLTELFQQTPSSQLDSVRSLCEERIRQFEISLNRQLAAILHHPRFQNLEASWLGIRYLVFNTETGSDLKIKLLPATKRELEKDFEKSMEFDESTLYKLIYLESFESVDGEPLGALVADFTFDNSPTDMELLRHLSTVGAAAFCPILSAAAPGLFGFESFHELNTARDLGAIFNSVEYRFWRNLRDSDDSRYLVLTMPRALARLPYSDSTSPVREFPFQEMLDRPSGEHDEYCWMNAAYLYASCLTRAFRATGQFLAIFGVENGGRLDYLPTHIVVSEDGNLDMRCPAEVQISDRRENELADLGFQPLCHYRNTDYAVFFGQSTVHKSRRYVTENDTNHVILAARLSHVLVTSRFAQSLMVMWRERVGSFMEAGDVERWMQNWLVQYVASSDDRSAANSARYPLRDASITIGTIPGQPGRFSAALQLETFSLFEVSARTTIKFRLPLRS